MKPTLQLKLGQHLHLTPQLQQAIQLLTLSTLELQLLIQQKLESNPMLELEEELITEEMTAATDSATYFTPTYAKQSSSIDSDTLIAIQPTETSLKDHLYWQLDLTSMSMNDKVIAIAIIDALDDNGLLECPLTEICAEVNAKIAEVETVLQRLQQFDPIGVGARDLKECLLIQLQALAETTPNLELTKKIVNQNLTLVAQHDYQKLLKHYHLNEEQLQNIIKLIQSLNPHPADSIIKSTSQYVIPDLFVTKNKQGWQVKLNEDNIPKLTINPDYAHYVQRACHTTNNFSLKDQLQEARWFIKSIASRNETLLTVANCIISHQQEFLDHGEHAMQPLILRDIAAATQLHESTVSRTTTGKYIHTPRGIFDLKHFFCSHVSTDDGSEYASTAIRALIKNIIQEESAKKPFSDHKIALLLQHRGINIARRTVTKYRELMSIPASPTRKRLTN